MLILLTAWIVHNWWKLLLGIVAIVVILEYHYYKTPSKEKSGGETEESQEPADRMTEEADREQDGFCNEKSGE